MRTLYLCFALVATGCATHQRQVNEYGQQGACNKIVASEIDIVLTDWKTAWEYKWTKDSLDLLSRRDWSKGLFEAAPKGARIGDQYWAGPVAGIPRDITYAKKLNNPFALGRSGRWLLAASYPATGFESDAPSKKLLLIDTVTKKVERAYEIRGGALSVTLSPDEQYFAVLEKGYLSANKTVKDSVASAIGHPIPYADLTISLYDRNGQALCSKLLVEDMPYISGYVIWK